jgi:hypothetical protein
VEVEFEALLMSATLPVALPAVVGANVTVNVADCPAARVSGSVMPVALKPAPVTFICEIVVFAFPELVTVTDCVVLVPVVTDPKSSEPGFSVNWPMLGLLLVPVNSSAPMSVALPWGRLTP